MDSELRRPPTLARKGSGSRPPTSRFQEGSMNDRTSAVPPAQFLGPDELREYENQFYAEPAVQHDAARGRRQDRPLSTPAQFQSIPVPRGRTESEGGQPHTVTHKKSTGFFNRVRDVLFSRGSGQQQGPSLKQHQEVRRKHSSLQEPLQHPHPTRPEYGRSQSDISVAQILANRNSGSDRPSREDIMASYNELVASGFFQSHAIQSTRHAAPGSTRETPFLPAIQGSPHTPARVSSIQAANNNSRSSSEAPAPRLSRLNREYGVTSSHPALAYTPSAPELHNKDSRHTLRSRKRGRGDAEEAGAAAPELHSSSSSTALFTEPLKRVAKKLRKMPSLGVQISTPPSTAAPIPSGASFAARMSGHQDGVVRLVPAVSPGGAVHQNERPIRLRSPSPAAGPEVVTPRQSADYSERAYYRAGQAVVVTESRRPRRTFSYTLTESSRGRTRASENDLPRSYMRDSSSTSSSRGARSNSRNPRVHNYGPTQTQTQTQTHTQNNNNNNNRLGHWQQPQQQRASLDDPVIHRDSTDSMRWERETAVSSNHSRGRSRTQQQQQQQQQQQEALQVLPDANRGIPAVPKLPERWHGTGRAYHLKDRGSRPELVAARRSEDSSSRSRFDKENNSTRTGGKLDADGDVDMLIVSQTRARTRGREEHLQQQHYWHIGNAL